MEILLHLSTVSGREANLHKPRCS